MTSSISISPVQPADVDQLVRKVEYPAHQDNPLERIRFPRREASPEQREEEINWLVGNLLNNVLTLQDNRFLYKACAEDGSPVGFIGWTTNPGAGIAKPVSKSELRKKKGCPAPPPPPPPPPSSLDDASWQAISDRLREERVRVLKGCLDRDRRICRLTDMAVDPNQQRQGIGSLLMKLFCEFVDENGLDAFVMSSPAALKLYAKFGFEKFGFVESEHGNFTSMLRTSTCSKREGEVEDISREVTELSN